MTRRPLSATKMLSFLRSRCATLYLCMCATPCNKSVTYLSKTSNGNGVGNLSRAASNDDGWWSNTRNCALVTSVTPSRLYVAHSRAKCGRRSMAPGGISSTNWDQNRLTLGCGASCDST